jgi:hypothetical protein
LNPPNSYHTLHSYIINYKEDKLGQKLGPELPAEGANVPGLQLAHTEAPPTCTAHHTTKSIRGEKAVEH